jgi:hypothetical protein
VAGSVKYVRVLIYHGGVDVNATAPVYRRTPLQEAVILADECALVLGSRWCAR